ncbi:MAG: sodium-independent anion transporter [Spirochaetota bacterium]
MNTEISYSISEYDGVKIVKFSGNISNSSKIEFESVVNSLSQKNNVILDMREVSVITSGGLSSLINVSNSARKRKKRVMIMGLRDGLIKMLEVMDVLPHITFIDNIEEGVAKA